MAALIIANLNFASKAKREKSQKLNYCNLFRIYSTVPFGVKESNPPPAYRDIINTRELPREQTLLERGVGEDGDVVLHTDRCDLVLHWPPEKIVRHLVSRNETTKRHSDERIRYQVINAFFLKIKNVEWNQWLETERCIISISTSTIKYHNCTGKHNME